jgi:imidazolonepropionase-like amidohydrolase
MRRFFLLSVLFFAGAAQALPALPEPEGALLALRARRVVTVSDQFGTIHDGVVVVRNRKIEAVGRWGSVALPAAAKVVDLGDVWLTPGLVEPHTHIGGTMDINEVNHPTNPELRVLESIVPRNPNQQRALAGGVTCAIYIPGSGTNLAGFGTIFKMHGEDLEDVLVGQPGVMKLAQAGNPERRSGDIGAGRMGMNWMIRDILSQGKEYREKLLRGAIEQDPRLHHMAKLWEGEKLPIVVHTQIFDVVQSTIRILHDDYGVRPVLDHSTFDGFLNAPLCAERGIAVCNGPRQIHYNRRTGKIHGCAAEWWAGGVRELSLNTDAPVIPQEELFFQSAMAVRYGLDARVGLPGVTINPARAFGIDDRVGSIEPGKDADLGVWTGDPIDPRSTCLKVWVNGKLAYCAKRDGQRF